MKRLLTAACLAAAFAATSARAEESLLGRPIADFKLTDYRGKDQSLSDFGDSKLVVVAFLGAECPLAKLYGPRLQEMSKEFAERGVAFIGIDANRQDSLTELAAYARLHGIEFPVLKDNNNVVADAFGATRTPEVFVLDADRKIRYSGRIDDQSGVGASSGYARPKVKRRDLAVAIEELLAGKPVSEPAVAATGCFIGRVSKVEPQGDVTYSNQIARVFQERCVSCHRPGEIAPFALQSYDEVVAWAETIREVIDDGRMPPWFANPAHGHFRNDSRLTDAEKKLVHTWIANGCPEGNASDLPEPREFAVGWQIPTPDQVVRMAEEAYTVPAEGVVEYKYFAVDPGWTEDKWIQAFEARPDNRSVVHHIIVYVQPPGRTANVFELEAIGGYAPGEGAEIHPNGIAGFVPAGSKLIFQMHYTPNGSEQKDNSFAGIKFADAKTVRKRARGGAIINFQFAIPPQADDFVVKAEHTFQRDEILMSLTPHMHLRGKSFKFEAAYPDGRREVLLDVPHWDFNWQLTYKLKEPKLIPAGTVLHGTASYDNSDNNLANPDPNSTIYWGDQTWEEMMVGFFGSVLPDEDLLAEKGKK